MTDGVSESIPDRQKLQSEAALHESMSEIEAEAPQRRPKVYGRLLWVASVVASILVIPYSVHFLRQMRGKPSLSTARSIRALCPLRLNRIRSFGRNLHPLPRSDD